MSKGYNIKNSCCLLCYCAPFSVFQTARVNCTTRLNFALPILLFIIELHKMEVGGNSTANFDNTLTANELTHKPLIVRRLNVFVYFYLILSILVYFTQMWAQNGHKLI